MEQVPTCACANREPGASAMISHAMRPISTYRITKPLATAARECARKAVQSTVRGLIAAECTSWYGWYFRKRYHRSDEAHSGAAGRCRRYAQPYPTQGNERAIC